MGNTQPANNTGKKVVTQKLEHAKKTGVLSLSEHKLEACPPSVFAILNLRTLDLSSNALPTLNPNVANLSQLKNLNLENNKLPAASLNPIARLPLQTLNAGRNRLGRQPTTTTTTTTTITTTTTTTSNNKVNNKTTQPPLPENLPKSLKQVKLHSNFLSSIPPSILSKQMTKLDKLDLSNNDICAIPQDIQNLVSLTELNLDSNMIVHLPDAIGKLAKLKVLSLRQNHISVDNNTNWSETNPQPLPQSLFQNTPVIDLNLHGNPMTSTQLNLMEGFETFLERRKKVKTSTLLGGALTNFDVCGLE